MYTTSDWRPTNEWVQALCPCCTGIAAQSNKVGDSGHDSYVLNRARDASILKRALRESMAPPVLNWDPGRSRGKLLLDATQRIWDVRKELEVLEVARAGEVQLLSISWRSSDATAPAPEPWAYLSLVRKHQRRPTTISADLPESDALVPAAVNWDAEPGAPWQALPYYIDRPLAVRSCCRATALTPEAVESALNDEASPLAAEAEDESWFFIQYLERKATVVARVTIRDKQLAQDYLEGWRRFLGGVLDALGRQVVMILAALSHLTQAPSFLLIMLAVARHYGRRGESDDHMLPAPASQHQRRQGAVCLAA